MPSSTHFRLALVSLNRNRVRTALTTLGIIIGVASMTLVLSLSEGARHTVTSQVDELGGDVILVEPDKDVSNELEAYNPYTTAVTSSLTEGDLESVQAIKGIETVAPLMLLSGSLVAPDDETRAPIVATNGDLMHALEFEIGSGQFIDETTNRDTVVLGQDLALELFGTNRTSSQQLKLKGRNHTVIGILKKTSRPLNLSGINLDKAAFISLEDGKSFNQGIAQIQQLTMRVDDVATLKTTADAVHASLLENHLGEEDFTVLAGRDIAHSADGLFNSIVTITTIVSAITLIVGGIGIMNIMLVSVAERTREIGIRKALGATDQHILWQFLIESLLMSLVAGIVGVALASLLSYIIAAELSFQPVISPFVITAGVSSAILVGIAFGLYPAVKASRKDPILALRQYQ